MTHATDLVTGPRKYPFIHMRIDDHSILNTIEGRYTCDQCSRSRKFFCYNCYTPVGNLGEIFPSVEIPIEIDIIKHKKEIDGKSTAVHAAILSKDRVHIYTYPEIPDYRLENDGVILIFPGTNSSTVAQVFGRKVRLRRHEIPKGTHRGTMMKRRAEEELENNVDDLMTPEQTYTYETLPVRKAVFIDSTWNQSRGIYKDERIKCLRTVVLQNRLSQFWRHQRGSPRWYLATIEAIHQLLLEVHVNAWGLNPNYRGLDNLEIDPGFYETTRLVSAPINCADNKVAPYDGQYDNLMYFFSNMYDLIHRYYDHNELKSYRRPI